MGKPPAPSIVDLLERMQEHRQQAAEARRLAGQIVSDRSAAQRLLDHADEHERQASALEERAQSGTREPHAAPPDSIGESYAK